MSHGLPNDLILRKHQECLQTLQNYCPAINPPREIKTPPALANIPPKIEINPPPPRSAPFPTKSTVKTIIIINNNSNNNNKCKCLKPQIL